jgi:hypothetical protein
MKAYDATSMIEAAPATIWAILTDAPSYSQWDSGVLRVDGRIAPGERLKLVSEANPSAPSRSRSPSSGRASG